MGLLDKVKNQAAVAASSAKEAAQKGQAKLDDLQAKRTADGLLRDLGATYYAEATGRQTSMTPTERERVLAALKQQEVEHGPISLVLESSGSAASAPSAPGGTTASDAGAGGAS